MMACASTSGGGAVRGFVGRCWKRLPSPSRAHVLKLVFELDSLAPRHRLGDGGAPKFLSTRMRPWDPAYLDGIARILTPLNMRASVVAEAYVLAAIC